MKKNLTRAWIITIAILFVGVSVIPSLSAEIKTKEIVPTMVDWSDNFDSYENGQFLDGDPEDEGWHGWDGVSDAGAYVVDDENLSAPHSVELIDQEDLVHEFEGIDSGQWTFTTFVYIPGNIMGIPYFIMLNTYSDGGPYHWSTQVAFDSNTGEVISEPELAILPLVYDEWVELRVEIDLDTDMQAIYYDGELLVEKVWSSGVSEPPGLTEIQCVDLWSSGASEHYYDNFTLEGGATGPNLDCEGSLNWADVNTGSTNTGSFTIENIGEAGSELSWEIDDYPDWGTWTFSDDSGTGLTPEDDPLTIDVEVVAPSDRDKEFSGTVKIVNTDNSNDFCTIDVSLSTPMSHNMPFVQRFIDGHPLIAKILGLL